MFPVLYYTVQYILACAFLLGFSYSLWPLIDDQ
jgi:hypothetical protein